MKRKVIFLLAVVCAALLVCGCKSKGQTNSSQESTGNSSSRVGVELPDVEL